MMITQRTNGLHSLVVLLQVFLTLFLYWVVLVVFTATRGTVNINRYCFYALVVATALIVESLRRDRSAIRTCLFEPSMLRLHPLAMGQTIAVAFGLMIFVTILKDATLSRLFLALFLTLLYPLLLFSNRILPKWLASNLFRGAREQRTLLVGPSQKITCMKPWISSKENFGVRVIGLLCDEEQMELVDGIPILGRYEHLERVIRERQVSQVIILGLPLVMDPESKVIAICNRSGARLMILSDLEERLMHTAIHIQDDGLQFITLRQEPLENPLNRLMKRFLDLLVSVPVVLFLLPPICVMVWIIHRRQSPGPLFHRQIRAGLQNLGFEILKFRTMHVHNGSQARQASENDERIFPAGKWLRKLSIDELPQFINVLRGEMSVVGPRPHLIEHNEQFAQLLADYHIRAFVLPGITGLAQIRGHRGEIRSTEMMVHRVNCDTAYLENWSLLLDIGIIMRTITQVIVPPKSAV